MIQEIVSNGESETLAFAKEFAKTLKTGDIVLLDGDLGAGKTVFTKGLVSALSNDEIVAALRTLQQAGLAGTYGSADVSFFTGSNSQQQLMNLMGGSSMNPQLIQSLLTNNMSLGF